MQCVVLSLSVFAALIRAVVWRIAAYNKGAWVAITLLFTVVLGIVEIYVHTKRLNDFA
jgi:hypothetical protein